MNKTLFGILIFILILPRTAPAADKTAIDNIQAIPELDGGTPPLESVIGAWDGLGRIDAVYADRIVINDLNFKINSGLKLIAMDGTPYKGVMGTGIFVYYFLGTGKTIVKMAMDPWKLPRKK